MSDWIGLIGAVLGGAITGWCAVSVGARQASTLLVTTRMQLGEQRAERILDERRASYLRFLDAANAVIAPGASDAGPQTGRAALRSALSDVQLAGPDKAAQAAKQLVDSLREGAGYSPDDRRLAMQKFTEAARKALESAG